MSEEQEMMQLVAKIFTCARCGFCCHGETTVSLDHDDQERMVQKLGMSRKMVARKFWRITGKTVQMKVVEGHCVFYNDKTGCAVHGGRPWRCGQWPLHPSILSDKANFMTIRESCPGINRELSYEEFCDVLQLLVRKERKMII